MKISFCFHDHQPVGNFQHVMEDAWSKCYSPMLEVLERHEGIPFALHLSGTLLEWLDEYHPEYMEKCAGLCREGRMEFLTSGRYEPVLPVFRREDAAEQIREFSDHLQERTGTRPAGLWLTERVWEPHLPSLLHEAGVSWAVVDDIHLRRGGVPQDDLLKPWITEDAGHRVTLLGSSRTMRYMIPFSPAERVMEELKRIAGAGGKFLFYGDDGEKFGVWPGTHQLCYKNGWLTDFLSRVEKADWLDAVLPSEAAKTDPAGPVYVPASSYPEMGEWTVHGAGRKNYDRAAELLRENGMEESSRIFLSGGFWRNFLSVYPESKELHGRILASEELIRESGDEEALHHFWRSQCNCAFWHGVFGGIYLPHLREAVWREINLAEIKALKTLNCYPRISSYDVTGDGREDTVISSPCLSGAVHSQKGLTLAGLTFIRPEGEPVVLGHTLTRQPEAYHSSIPKSSGSGEAQTIHSEMGAKEEGLFEKLVIDRWRRTCFTDLVMDPNTEMSRWASSSEAVHSFRKASAEPGIQTVNDAVVFNTTGSVRNVEISKKLEVRLGEPVIKASSRYKVKTGMRTGTEVCLNLMTGRAKDRYYRVDSGRKRLMGQGASFKAKRVEVVDEWRRTRVILETESPCDIWVAPMDSVNRSESGYESVHQGTAFYFSRITDEKGSADLKLTLRMEETVGS